MPLPAVQAALRKTTELLAHELARPGAQAPEWTESEWRVARAVVAIHGVSGLLAGTLRWQGPADWRLFLEEQRAQIAQRLPRIQALLRELTPGRVPAASHSSPSRERRCTRRACTRPVSAPWPMSTCWWPRRMSSAPCN